MAAEHTRSEQECPTSIIVDNRTDEHGNDDSNINNNHMNENEIEDNHKEEEEQPLLQVREQLKYLMILVDSLYCNMQNTGKIPAKYRQNTSKIPAKYRQSAVLILMINWCVSFTRSP